LLALDSHDRQEAGEDVGEADERLAVGGIDAPRTDPGSPQRLAVGIAQLGDERTHVGAAAALDLVAAALAVLAPELLEATDVHDPFGHLERLPPPCAFVRAHAGDADRRVG